LALLLGFSCLAGAATLAWLSSPATMHLTRTGGEAATIDLESRLFGVFPIDGQRIAGVRSVSMSADTAPRLIFATSHGPIDAGRAQQLFAADFADIKAFLQPTAVEPGLAGERATDPSSSPRSWCCS
jgi:hypothetical protein